MVTSVLINLKLQVWFRLMQCLFGLFILVITTPLHAAINDVITVSYGQKKQTITSNQQVAIDLYQNQAFKIKLDVQSDDEFAYLQYPQLQSDDFTIINARSKQLKLVIENQTVWIKSLHITVWPRLIGTRKLQLPDASLWLSGKPLRKIPLPSLTINITPVPEYISPDILVGNLSIHMHSVNDSFFDYFKTPDTVSKINLDITSNDIHPEQLIYVTKKFAPEPGYLLTIQNKTNYFDPVSTTVAHTSILHMNYPDYGLNLPKPFTIEYFDPVEQRIYTTSAMPPVIIVFPVGIWVVILLLVMVIALVLARKLYRISKRIHARRQQWRKILDAYSAEELSLALRHFPANHVIKYQPHTHLSHDLGQWLSYWQQIIVRPEYQLSLSTSVAQLNQLLYSRQPRYGLSKVKQSIVMAISSSESFTTRALQL